MTTSERDTVAAVGIAGAVEGKFNHADAEVIDHSQAEHQSVRSC
jgi:hypothetical protein